jgi:peptidyl-prolyl cis-trans isomerase C
VKRRFATALGLASLATAAPTEVTLLKAGSQTLSLRAAQETVEHLPLNQRAGGARQTLDKVLIPQFLFALRGAEVLRKDGRQRDVENALLSDALEHSMRSSLQVTEAQIAGYYEAHAPEFTVKQGLLLSRILVSMQTDAAALIAKLNSAEGVKQWNAVTREKSQDEATKWREGSLGFVRDDGSTDVPQVRVNPGLFLAASGVKDGEIVPHPVVEGQYFAVVWRRGTRPAQTTPPEQASPRIRALLERQALRSQFQALRADLRSKYLTQYVPDTVEAITYAVDPGIPVPNVPLIPRAAAVTAAPTPGDRGER